ncbi:WD40 repeat domain-containing protein [Leptolyngbya sp. AN02str]|uniref:WD40 repeat domain-containing protein n=1 Tax=Leptolyngbya sp. AN02str TaxID=3423363 RepID=UPI003D31F5D7
MSEPSNNLQPPSSDSELRSLLLDFRWLQAKLEATSVDCLLRDYELLPLDLPLKLMKHALEISAPVLVDNPHLLASRLLGHLLAQPQPEVQALLAQAQQHAPRPWLRPLQANLIAPDGALLDTLECGSVRVVKVSPDLRWAICNAIDRRRQDGTYGSETVSEYSLKVWDLGARQLVQTLATRVDVFALDVSADFTQAVTGGNNFYDVTVWDLQQGAVLHTLKGHQERVSAIALSADGKRAISGSHDETLKVWDLQTGELLHTLVGQNAKVDSVAVSADFTRAISSSNGMIIIWDLEAGQAIQTLRNGRGIIRAVAVSTDFTQAITAYEKLLKVWDLQSGTVIQTLEGHSGGVNAVVASADFTRALSAGKDNTLRLWDVQTGTVLKTMEVRYLSDFSKSAMREAVWSVAVSADFTRAIAVGSGKLKVWDLQRGEVVPPPRPHRSQVTQLALSADGTRAISVSQDRTLKLWDVQTRQAIQTLRGRILDSAVSVAVSDDFSQAVSIHYGRLLHVWDIQAEAVVQTSQEAVLHSQGDSTLPYNERYSVRLEDGSPIAVTADFAQAIAVVATTEGPISVWNLRSGQRLQTLERQTRTSNAALVLSTDGHRLLSAAEDEIKVWDLQTGAVVQRMEVMREKTWDTKYMLSIATSADFTQAISASSDCTLKLWDLERGQLLHTFEGHQDHVLSVSVNADFSRALSASYDNTLKLWDLHTRTLITTFVGDRPFLCATLSADGKTAIAGDYGGCVHFFSVEE